MKAGEMCSLPPPPALLLTLTCQFWTLVFQVFQQGLIAGGGSILSHCGVWREDKGPLTGLMVSTLPFWICLLAQA